MTEEKKELQKADFKDLGPVDPKRPNIHSFVYVNENYSGPIAMDAKVSKSMDDIK